MRPVHGLLLAALLLVIIVGSVVVFEGSNNEAGSQNDLDRLSTTSFIDYEGNTVSLEAYRGKPLVINSWAAWCPFCRQELADFAALQKEFSDIVVIAIDRAEPLETAQGYTDTLGISEDLVLLLDPDDDFYKNIGGFSMPETIFVTGDGTIAFHKRGFLSLDEMRTAVIEHLQ
ncbi:TlpA family protein disulfide reductase [Candidatus Parcubacteria bacterium]|nr:TlpA family protein disulfide reductase [Candidatus Parcubacteria bacterium]